jgi:hypothetical protein
MLRETETPMTDVCFEHRNNLIRIHGTADGVGPEFEKGNPFLLARSLERRNATLRSQLEDALEFVEDQEDTRDGGDGRPLPNDAMLLAMNIRAALAQEKRDE